MKLVTWNVNGIRAALQKGMERRLADIGADVVMLQEIRCTVDKLPKGWTVPDPFRAHWHPAQKPGWSGVAAWSRVGLDVESVGLTGEDTDGRLLVTRAGGVRIVNTYLPSGSAGPEKQVLKETFMASYLPFLARYVDDPVPTLVVGDLNIAPSKNDVHEPTRAAKISGFLPHEREWFGKLYEGGWTDVVRRDAGDRKGPYTWWSNFGRAKLEDRGWRLDHVLANRAAAPIARFVGVDREAGIACSDHAPVVIEVDAVGRD